MRLDHLHIQNFRCYEDAHFDFQPGFNLVVGVNGSGKTSLLQAVAASFNGLSGDDVMASFSSPILEDDTRFVIENHDGRIRSERRLPIFLAAEGDALGLSQWMIHLLKAGSRASEESFGILNVESHVDLPVLAFYRANRRWRGAGVSAEFAAQQKVSRVAGYTNWSEAVTDLQDFESWLIGKTLERMQNLLDAGTAPLIFDDELAWVNQAIQIALPQSENLRYDLRLQRLLVDIDSGKTIPFNDLSDGQRGLIARYAEQLLAH